MSRLENMLKGGDLRSIGQSDKVVLSVGNQEQFDKLFAMLFHSDRKVVMRAADAIEKITIASPHYLKKHKEEIFELCNNALYKELKWHLALLAPRLILTKKEQEKIWQLLTAWVRDKNESKIVRVNSLEGLTALLPNNKQWANDFTVIMQQLEEEKIPSVTARIKKLRYETTGQRNRL
jgi:hypothetical protein